MEEDPLTYDEIKALDKRRIRQAVVAAIGVILLLLVLFGIKAGIFQ